MTFRLSWLHQHCFLYNGLPRLLVFPTRLLTSEDEYKWYWRQMIYFPETINTISTRIQCHRHIHLFLLKLCTLTYSVHAGILKPWRGCLLWLLVVFPSYHVFSLPLSGLNWRSLFPPWGSSPPFPKMATPFTGSAHTPLSGSRTISFWGFFKIGHQMVASVGLRRCKFCKHFFLSKKQAWVAFRPYTEEGENFVLGIR